MRVRDDLKTFVAMEMILSVKSVNLDMRRELYERLVVLTVT